MKSIFKKGMTILENGIEPIEEGMANYAKNDPIIEQKARERFDKCKGCDNLVNEPIKMFKVKDERIKRASDMMCDDCGCAIPYLIRQNLKVCKFWED